ncbi:MAG: hypothetical protein PHY93_20860 [Bacteriovorax sp.]|nr:hypothetical protein [Bacteriovorax sp.]
MTKFIRVMLFPVLTIFILTSAFSTEKECRVLKKDVQKLTAENEKIQEEAGRQSLTMDKAQRKAVNAKMAKLARSAEDLIPKINKANCNQYEWFADTNNQPKKEESKEAVWCQLNHTECNCEYSPSDILGKKEYAEEQIADQRRDLKTETEIAGKPAPEYAKRLKNKTELFSNFVAIKETKGTDDKVVKIEINKADKEGNSAGSATYFRTKKDCEKETESFKATAKKEEDAKAEVAKKKLSPFD